MRKKMYISKFFSFIAGVIDTTDNNSFANMSEKFCKKFENLLMGYSGMIQEKNLKWPI
jgi:hypothetical protein